MSRAYAPKTQKFGDLYRFWALDWVVEAAEAIARDFSGRPKQYQSLDSETAALLKRLPIGQSTDNDLPNLDRRSEGFRSYLAGQGCFAGPGLRAAANELMAGPPKRDKGALRQVVAEEALLMADTLSAVDGSGVESFTDQISELFDASLNVITSDFVGRRYEPWGNGDGFDPRDSSQHVKFAHHVANLLESTGRARTRTVPGHQKLAVLLRVANHGAVTIEGAQGIRDGKFDEDEVDEVARNAYRWARDLRSLLPGLDVVRAWKDDEYLIGLENVERSLVPANPAGEIDLEGSEFGRMTLALQAVDQTCTTGCNVCCCPSPQDTINQGSCGTCIGFTCSGCDVVIV